MTQLVIFEGPDGAGKTTTARALARALDAVYVHHGKYDKLRGDQLARVYFDSMLPALEGAASVVLDRAWHSEPVYGEVFRLGVDRLGSWARMLERAQLAVPSRIVYMRTSFERLWSIVGQRRDVELAQRREQLERVVGAYERASWVSDALAVDVSGASTEALVEAIARSVPKPTPAVAELRALGVVGNVLTTKLTLLVGERASEAASTALPFISFSLGGCSYWLADELRNHSVRERDLAWVNAFRPDGTDVALERVVALLRPKRVIALGKIAAQALDARGVAKHIDVPHPQYIKRFFHASADKYKLFELLGDATDGR